MPIAIQMELLCGRVQRYSGIYCLSHYIAFKRIHVNFMFFLNFILFIILIFNYY